MSDCKCGGTFMATTDDLTGLAGDQVCSGCGRTKTVCQGCGQVRQDWVVEGKICVECGPGCVSGDINVDLSDTNQGKLLAWAERQGLLPTP